MLRELTQSWWLVTLEGLAGIIFGLMVIAWPQVTLSLVIILIGLYALIRGIIVAISGLLHITKSKDWWINILQGVISFAVGYLILNWPLESVQVATFAIALWLLVTGIIQLALAILIRKETENEWLLAAVGAVSLIFGFILLSRPIAAIFTFSFIIALYAIISGVLTFSMGIKLRSLKN